MSISQSPWAESKWELRGANLVLPLVEAAYWPRQIFVLIQDSSSAVLCQPHFSAFFFFFCLFSKASTLWCSWGTAVLPVVSWRWLSPGFLRDVARCKGKERVIKARNAKAGIYALTALLTWWWWGLKVQEGFVSWALSLSSTDRQRPWLYRLRLLSPYIPESLPALTQPT